MLKKFTKTILAVALSLTTILTPLASASEENVVKFEFLDGEKQANHLKYSFSNMNKDSFLMKIKGDKDLIASKETIIAYDVNSQIAKDLLSWAYEVVKDETHKFKGNDIGAADYSEHIELNYVDSDTPLKDRNYKGADEDVSEVTVEITKLSDSASEIFKNAPSPLDSVAYENLKASAEYETQEVTIKLGETKEISNFVKKGEKPAEQSTTVNTEETTKAVQEAKAENKNTLYIGLGLGAVLAIGLITYFIKKKK